MIQLVRLFDFLMRKRAVIAWTKLAGTADRHLDTPAFVLNRWDGRA